MGSRGEGYVVLQLILMALVALGPSTWPGLPNWPATRLALIGGIVLIVLGSALVVAGIAALGRNLTATPRPKQGATLVTRGPYRFVRHPMYSGATLAAFGWAFAVHGWLTLVYATALLVFFDIKARREERWLRQEIPGYSAHAQHVRRLIPFIY